MNKQKYVALISGVTLLIIMGYVFFTKIAPSSDTHGPDQATTTPSESGSNVSTDYVIVPVHQEDMYMVVTAEYPQTAYDTINAQLKQFVDHTIADFRSAIPNSDDVPERKYLMSIEVKHVYIGSDFVSVQFSVYRDFGGAHGLGMMTGKTYVTQTGKEVVLDDVLALTGETLWSLSEKVTAAFKQSIGDVFFEEGASPVAENYAAFTVSPDEVTFYFAPYQVAAYALGPQEFSLPRIH